MQRKQTTKKLAPQTGAAVDADYAKVLSGIVGLLERARHAAARAVNSVMTATYWEVGRRIAQVEQGGKQRAEYGEQLLERLAEDLTARFSRGFGRENLRQMRNFHLAYATIEISQTVSGKFNLADIAKHFPLSWSHYVKLLGVRDEHARAFYETEALRGEWTVRQLERQIGTQFYQRTALSRDKAAMLTKGAKAKPEDAVTPEEELKSPYVLEFLGLKDEYSESELEEALIQHLEKFLLELGPDFTFVGRQKRLRIDDEWYRVDLVFFHRRLRCLLLLDLKLNKLTPGDVGQMHVYCNYAKHHWTLPDENPPIGLILCAGKGVTLAKYALEGLPNKVMAADYQTALPDKTLLEEELMRTRALLEARRSGVEVQAEKRPARTATKRKPAGERGRK